MKAPKDLERYTAYYNAEKLWKKIKRHARKIGAKAVYYALVLYYALQSPTITKKDKLIIYGALGYLILPIDLLPDFLPGGYTDDVAGLAIAIFKIARNITPATTFPILVMVAFVAAFAVLVMVAAAAALLLWSQLSVNAKAELFLRGFAYGNYLALEIEGASRHRVIEIYRDVIVFDFHYLGVADFSR